MWFQILLATDAKCQDARLVLKILFDPDLMGVGLLQGPTAGYFLMSEVQGYLAHKKTPTPLGPP